MNVGRFFFMRTLRNMADESNSYTVPVYSICIPERMLYMVDIQVSN